MALFAAMWSPPQESSPGNALEAAILEGNVPEAEALAEAAGVDSDAASAQANATKIKISHIKSVIFLEMIIILMNS